MKIIDLTTLLWIKPKYDDPYQKRLVYQASGARILSIFSLDDLAGFWGTKPTLNMNRLLLNVSQVINRGIK